MKNPTLHCAATPGADVSASQGFPSPPTRAEDTPQGDRAGWVANQSVVKADSRIPSKARVKPLRGRARSAKGVRSSRDRVSTPNGAGDTGPRKSVAASDDAHISHAAGIEPTGPGRADRLSPDRPQNEGDACAAAALPRQEIEKEEMARPKPDEAAQANKSNDELKVPTDLAALEDGPSYVRAVAAKVDLVGASAKLVVSQDEKIAKAELDRLRELIFGKGGPPPFEETVQMDFSSMYRTAPEPAKCDAPRNGEDRGHN